MRLTTRTSSPEMTSPSRAATILVVDDQPEMVQLVAHYLTRDGHHVVVALSGADARRHMASVPDLVLLDVMMRDANGFDLCREFKADPATALVPVVLVTSLNDRKDRIRGIEAGCDEFLSKPVHPDELRARVTSLLQLQATRRELEDTRMANAAAQHATLRRTFERYVAPQVVEQILAQGGDPFGDGAGTRFDAVVLFADLRGFTPMTETLLPKDVISILNAYFSALTVAAHRHQGTTFSMAGDSLLVGFGVPLALESAERAAFAAARDMMLATEPLLREWKQRYGVELGVGIGLNGGEVIAGSIGSPSYSSYTIIGDAVNVASRLTAQAQAGEIVSSGLMKPHAEAMGLLLERTRDFEAQLKGKDKPIAACGWQALPDKPPPRILVMDDQPEFRAIVRRFVRIEWPKAVVTDYDPIALGFPTSDYDWSGHDVILLDYMMDPHDGLDWLRRLRARPGVPPIVFMTGSGSETVAAQAMKGGATDYLPKHDLSRRRLADAILAAIENVPAEPSGPDDPQALDLELEFEVRPAPGSLAEHIAISGYRMIRKLGEGGMAVVYLAQHLASGEERVLKILDTKATDDTDFLDRFVHEYGVVSRIQSPHVVRIHDQGLTANHAYISMEVLTGGDLKQRMAKGPLEPEDAMRIFRELLSALIAVHAQGIVHRDLKPQNIMFREDGSSVLLDFGIAKDIEAASSRTKVGMLVGTPMYMSPEQADGLNVDYRADLYSAGVILYEMLTGSLPYKSNSIVGLISLHRKAPIPRLPKEVSHYQVLIDRLMAKEPEHRFQSARELLPDGP